jgi:catechol 2,3-dioxygenase-like lactoylglutathione lyase family enzyme
VASSAPGNTLGAAAPIFPVANLAAAIDFYVNTLGFRLNWQHQDLFASVSRDKCNIMLSEGDQCHAGTWTWIGVTDASPLEDELRDMHGRLWPTF